MLDSVGTPCTSSVVSNATAFELTRLINCTEPALLHMPGFWYADQIQAAFVPEVHTKPKHT